MSLQHLAPHSSCEIALDADAPQHARTIAQAYPLTPVSAKLRIGRADATTYVEKGSRDRRLRRTSLDNRDRRLSCLTFLRPLRLYPFWAWRPVATMTSKNSLWSIRPQRSAPNQYSTANTTKYSSGRAAMPVRFASPFTLEKEAA